MGRFEQIKLPDAANELGNGHPHAAPSVKSLLTDAQNEELRRILSQPIDIATDAEMKAIFEDWGD